MSYRSDQSGLQCDTPHLKQTNTHTHKHKTQILINNLINWNKQIKMQSASFRYRSIASPVWQPVQHLSVSRSLCFFHSAMLQTPWQTAATQFLCYPSHWVQILPLLDVWWSPSFLQWLHRAPSGPFGSVFLLVHAVSLCSLAWAASKEKHKIILACYSFVCIGIPSLCIWIDSSSSDFASQCNFLHVSSTWCSINFLDS